MHMEKGIYCLIIHLANGKKIKIGKLGIFYLKKGFYVYTGSSQNSLQRRLKRHLSVKKKLHWHVDYLLKYAKIIEINVIESLKKDECRLSNEIGLLPGANIIIIGFGSSDCSCKTHLYFFKKRPKFKIEDSNQNISILNRMKNYVIDNNHVNETSLHAFTST